MVQALCNAQYSLLQSNVDALNRKLVTEEGKKAIQVIAIHCSKGYARSRGIKKKGGGKKNQIKMKSK